MTAGPEQIDSPYNKTCIQKRIAMIKTALNGAAQQWCSHLSLDTKKLARVLPLISKKLCFDVLQLQTKARVILEGITRALENK